MLLNFQYLLVKGLLKQHNTGRKKSMKHSIKILLVEDNQGDAFLIEDHLEEFASFSYELIKVETLSEALCQLNNRSFDVILLDLELPDSSGINTFSNLHNNSPMVPIIILTGLNDKKIGTHAAKAGARAFLVKGKSEGRLLECILQYGVAQKKKSSPNAGDSTSASILR